jgi:pimeloyl-ACP methyl ester carboxylesterase
VKHAVIYIFGLSDQRARGQTLAVRFWKLYGVTPEVFHMYWETAETFEAKLAPLLERIDALTASGYTVSLVGTSAGASVAVQAFYRRPAGVHRVVSICGKLQNPQTVHPGVFRKNPAFREALALLPAALAGLASAQLARILSVRPVTDESVPPADTVVPGAQSRQVPTMGHGLSIGYCVTLYAPRIMRFIKSA